MNFILVLLRLLNPSIQGTKDHGHDLVNIDALLGKGVPMKPNNDQSTAHVAAIMDPRNKMDLRIIATFAKGIPLPYVTSLETVMILYLGSCKASPSASRSENLIRLLKAARPDNVYSKYAPLNGTLPSMQGCRRRAHIVDPTQIHHLQRGLLRKRTHVLIVALSLMTPGNVKRETQMWQLP